VRESGVDLVAMRIPAQAETGRRVSFGDDSAAEIVEVLGGRLRRVRSSARSMRAPRSRSTARCPSHLQSNGSRRAADHERYQTVYAARRQLPPPGG